jgi:putative ABC transport system permease protein
MVQGTASVEGGGRERQTVVSGTGDELPQALSFRVALGEFLPADNLSAPRAFAVLGSKVRSELFGVANPLGVRIRVGGQRYTVIGVMESKGTMFGFDLDDAVYIPVAKGLELFNREGLFEIDVLYEEGAPVEEVVKAVSRVLIARHGGEDFTITTQQQMLEVLGSVLNVVTFAVGALGGISLLVGGVGIFTIMTIAVRERTAEIGLLQAIGARRRQIRDVFLGESLLLAAIGGLSGVLLGLLCITLLVVAVPALPVSPAWGYMGLAVGVSLLIGLIAGVLPAIRAAQLDPVESLRAD